MVRMRSANVLVILLFLPIAVSMVAAGTGGAFTGKIYLDTDPGVGDGRVDNCDCDSSWVPSYLE